MEAAKIMSQFSPFYIFLWFNDPAGCIHVFHSILEAKNTYGYKWQTLTLGRLFKEQ